MNTETASSTPRKAASPGKLWQPDETFWQHYSPHHEFPLATVSALTLCGVAVGLLFLWWILGGFDLNSEADGPVRVDAASIGPEGGGGGYDGLGTGNAPLTAKDKTELANDESVKTAKPSLLKPIDPDTKIATEDIKPYQLPVSPPDFKDSGDYSKAFEVIQREAKQAEFERNVEAEREKVRKAAAQAKVNGSGGPPGGRNTPGAGGGIGGGVGPGTGSRVGPGIGGGGDINGRPATLQEIHAYRWRITLSRDIDQHVRTLIAMRVTYIFKDASGRFYQVRDLRRTPVELSSVPPVDPSQVVCWYQTDVLFLRALAQRLKVPFSPTLGIITLPADVEEKLATVEHEALEKARRPERTVRMTLFDVKLLKDAYEPYVSGFQ